MSEATKKVRDFLTKSPSVVYPDDVLGLFEQVERENAELREDNDRLVQAIEELHSVSLEDRLVQMENDNDKLRDLVTYVLKGFVVAVDEWETWELRHCFDNEKKTSDTKKQFEIIRHYFDGPMRELETGVGE